MEGLSAIQQSLSSNSTDVLVKCPLLIHRCLDSFIPDPGIVASLLESACHLVQSGIDLVSQTMLQKLPQIAQAIARFMGGEYTVDHVMPLFSLIPDSENPATLTIAARSLRVLLEWFDRLGLSAKAILHLCSLVRSPKAVNRAVAALALEYAGQFLSSAVFWEILDALSDDDSEFVRCRVPALIACYAGRFEDAEQLCELLLALADDESDAVRSGIISELFEITTHLRLSIRLTVIEPVLTMILSDSATDCIVSSLGPVIGPLGSGVSPAVVRHYSLLLASPSADVQWTAAFSFPAVANALGSARFVRELLPSFKRCCSAEDPRVRRTLAFGLSAFAPIVPRSDLTDAAFDLARDIPDVSVGIVSHLSEILPLVDDRGAFAICIRNPGARFPSWRMRLRVSEQLRRCAAFLDRGALLDCACELIDDDVAAVRSDAVRSLAALIREGDLAIVEDFAASVNHWTRLCAARLMQSLPAPIAARARGVLPPLIGDRAIAVRTEATVAWQRLADIL
jgi:hypothetical protein